MFSNKAEHLHEWNILQISHLEEENKHTLYQLKPFILVFKISYFHQELEMRSAFSPDQKLEGQTQPKPTTGRDVQVELPYVK